MGGWRAKSIHRPPKFGIYRRGVEKRTNQKETEKGERNVDENFVSVYVCGDRDQLHIMPHNGGRHVDEAW